jgi:hypothetical protein
VHISPSGNSPFLVKQTPAGTSSSKKLPKFSCEWFLLLGRVSVRITNVIFAGSVAALAVLATPALTKNSDSKTTDVQQSDGASAPPPCYSYEPKPDGSWTQFPCQEVGAAQPPQHKSAARKPDEDLRAHHTVR